MTWYPTNTDDVTLIVQRVNRDENGTPSRNEIANTAAIVVDDFTIGSDEDLEGLSGVGNNEPLGISRGDVEHTFSFTVQGEDASLFRRLATGEGPDGPNGQAVELEIIVKMQDYKDKLTGAYAGTREVSGSSGDPIEFQAEGIAMGRSPGTVGSDE